MAVWLSCASRAASLLERGRDIDIDRGAAAGEEPDPMYSVGRQGRDLRFCEGQPVASQRVHRVQRRSPDDAVVALAKIRRIGIFRIVRKEHLRSPAADPLDQRPPQRGGILHRAVGFP